MTSQRVKTGMLSRTVFCRTWFLQGGLFVLTLLIMMNLLGCKSGFKVSNPFASKPKPTIETPSELDMANNELADPPESYTKDSTLADSAADQKKDREKKEDSSLAQEGNYESFPSSSDLKIPEPELVALNTNNAGHSSDGMSNAYGSSSMTSAPYGNSQMPAYSNAAPSNGVPMPTQSMPSAGSNSTMPYGSSPAMADPAYNAAQSYSAAPAYSAQGTNNSYGSNAYAPYQPAAQPGGTLPSQTAYQTGGYANAAPSANQGNAYPENSYNQNNINNPVDFSNQANQYNQYNQNGSYGNAPGSTATNTSIPGGAATYGNSTGGYGTDSVYAAPTQNSSSANGNVFAPGSIRSY